MTFASPRAATVTSTCSADPVIRGPVERVDAGEATDVMALARRAQGVAVGAIRTAPATARQDSDALGSLTGAEARPGGV